MICRGDWPKSLDCSDKVALQQAFDYYSVIVDTDISKVDNVHRNKGRAHRLMRTYARFIGSQATLQSISNDLQINEAQTISDDTISSYINALKRIFVIEDSSAWNPNLRSKTAIRSSDTTYKLAESSTTMETTVNVTKKSSRYYFSLLVFDLFLFSFS